MVAMRVMVEVCVCVDVRRGSCWVTLVDSRCEGSVHSHITKVECCSSVGVAWGSPCEKCPHAEVIAVIGQATAVPFSPSIAPGQHLTHTHTHTHTHIHLSTSVTVK